MKLIIHCINNKEIDKFQWHINKDNEFYQTDNCQAALGRRGHYWVKDFTDNPTHLVLVADVASFKGITPGLGVVGVHYKTHPAA